MRPKRIRCLTAVLVAALVGGAQVADAHDFWLVPDAFQVAAAGELSIRGQTSSHFPTSESAVALDRVQEARLVSARDDQRITDLSHHDRSLLLRRKPTAKGQYVVAVTLHPRSSRESVAGFRRYLTLEGAPAALERIEREGLLTGRDSLTRRYAKYAKTFVQVGSGGAPAFQKVLGHPLEFVPLADPAMRVGGDTFRVQVLYAGRPLTGLHAHAGRVEWPLRPDSALKAGARSADISLVSDELGVLRVPITGRGLWNVRAIHVDMAPAQSGADWDTHWATMVFLVGSNR